jgi:fatty acid-binding protein DegV
VVCKKLRSPHGRSLIGAATALGAEGCSAVAINTRALRIHGIDSFVIVKTRLGELRISGRVEAFASDLRNKYGAEPITSFKQGNFVNLFTERLFEQCCCLDKNGYLLVLKITSETQVCPCL